MMTMDFPIPIDNLISININAIMKCTLTFLARSLATSRLSLVQLFKPWPYSCWNVALFDFKMQLVLTIPLVVKRIKIQIGYLNIFFDIFLCRHSLAHARPAGCCLSELNTTPSARAWCCAFTFSKTSRPRSMSCRRTNIMSSSSL